MKKVFFIVIILFVALILASFINEDWYSFTGKVTAGSFIKSINPSGDIQTTALTFYVSTSVVANCSYALSLKDDISYRYFKPMEFSNGYEHRQLLTGLKNGEYDINVKCTNENGIMQTAISSVDINLPLVCAVYCQYKDRCDEFADDSCGGVCRRETDGLNCGENKICVNGGCIEKVEEAKVEIVEEEPRLVQKELGLFEKLSLWLKSLFS